MKNLAYSLYDAYLIENTMKPVWEAEGSDKWEKHVLLTETLKCIGEEVLHADLVSYVKEVVQAIEQDVKYKTSEHTCNLLTKLSTKQPTFA